MTSPRIKIYIALGNPLDQADIAGSARREGRGKEGGWAARGFSAGYAERSRDSSLSSILSILPFVWYPRARGTEPREVLRVTRRSPDILCETHTLHLTSLKYQRARERRPVHPSRVPVIFPLPRRRAALFPIPQDVILGSGDDGIDGPRVMREKSLRYTLPATKDPPRLLRIVPLALQAV